MSERITTKGLPVRRITFWIMSTVAALVLLFSYRTSTGGSAPATLPVEGAAPGIVSAPSPGPSATGPSTTATVANGTVAQTQWGPVQVRVTIAAGRITDVTTLQYPQGNPRDAEINAYALPVLHDAVIAAQSARVDAVSGATVTSDGYLSSLQAALDTVHFG